MKLKIALATATAMGVLMGGAWANNGNTLYIEQLGESNVADVNQSAGGGNNDIGTVGDPVTQSGDRNNFRYSNTPSGSGVNNDITKAEQIGDDNIINVQNWNNSNNNTISDLQQNGDANRARIHMNGSDNGGVGIALQQGNANHLVIEQSGSSSSGNTVVAVSQIGNNNGLGPDGNGDWRRAGTYIFQSGTENTVTESRIVGDDNIGPAGGSNTYRNTHRIEQRGVDNTASAVTLGSKIGTQYNQIWILQTGDENSSNVKQGLNTSSTGNIANVTQTGNNNEANGDQQGSGNSLTVNQIGDDNLVDSIQIGNDNVAAANITGSGNGSGALSGVALTRANAFGLSSGSIIQEGNLNAASLTISNSDNNQFAFLQDGDSNSIVGTVSGGGSNSATMTQVGSNNISNFSQVGTFNQVAVSQ
jgi:hypothetical protein